MNKAALALALLTISSLPANAAPSADDAAKLQATLQSYFGSSGQSIKVSPDGDGFKAVIDFSAAFLPAKASGAEVIATPLELHLVPDGTGKWKVAHDGPMKLSMKMKDQLDLLENFESFTFNGTFDEATSTFVEYEAKAANITLNETASDPAGANIKAEGKFDSIGIKGTATANASGGNDLKIVEEVGPGSLHENIAAKDGAPIDLQFKFAGADMNATIAGARTAEFLPVMQFMSSHQDKAAVVKDQQPLKDMLTALLPVFNTATGQANFGKLDIQTPIGPASIEKLSATFNLNGAVKDGHFEEGLAIEGLTLPPGLVPAWAAALVPKASGLNVAISGYDAETPAKAWLKDADLSKDEPVPAETLDALMATFLPKGTVDVTFNKTGVSNDTYAFTAEGTFSAGPQAVPSGKARLTAKGLDDIMKVIQASPPEAGLQEGAAMIIAAKGLGKPGADGTLSYDVEATPDGKVLVNGTDMSKFGK